MESIPSLAIVTRLSRPARYLERVLDGFLLQTGAHIHWSIITQLELNGDYAKCFKRAKDNGIAVTITKAAPNIPLGQLANLGVNATQSEFVMLHDDDDTLRGDFVGGAMRLMHNKDLAGVTCHAAVIHEDGSDYVLDFVLSPGMKFVCETSLAQDNLIVTNALIYRRAGFEAADGYPQDVTVAEDWLFNMALIAEGPIAVLPKIYAEVYIRGKRPPSQNSMRFEATHHNTVVTHETAHIEMETRIRKDPYKPVPIIPIDRQAHNQALYQRLRRFIDRITYKIGGWYLPRF